MIIMIARILLLAVFGVAGLRRVREAPLCQSYEEIDTFYDDVGQIIGKSTVQY